MRHMHNITKEDYMKSPCGVCSTAYWKNNEFEKPDNIKVIHERDFNLSINNTSVKYFRLLHKLNHIDVVTNEDFIIENVNIITQKEIVSNLLEKCYNTKYTIETINKWINYRVFDNDLWIFALEKNSRNPVALGIADFDLDLMEGSLEWIQVLPQYRRLGLGQLIVNELLIRLKSKAKFATVSGECDNETKPDLLYRKCGFWGDDIWHVVYT